MEQEVILEVERLEDAEEAARKHFGLPGANVRVEVLRPGRSGLLRKEPWQVRCVLSSPDGTAEVRNGEIVIQGPGVGGKPAQLRPIGLKVRLNGQDAAEPIFVRPGDRVEVIFPLGVPTEAPWEIQISADHLTATLTLRPQRSYRLKDAPPANILSLEAQAENAYLPPPREALNRALSEAGIRFGLIPENIEALIANPGPQPVVVAKGEPAVPAEDARVDILVETSPEQPPPPEEGEEGRVDYRVTREIVSVESETLLAVKHPAKPGKEGRGVDGAVLPTTQPLDIRLVAGPGTELSPDGLEVRSTMAGEPVVHSRGREVSLEVIPVLVHQGNVGLKSGNLQFEGGIVIRGNVEDRSVVRAGLSLEIQGQVDLARLIAGADISVRGNVFGSSLTAGEGEGIPITLWEDLESLRRYLSGPEGGRPPERLNREELGELCPRLRERIERSVARKHPLFVELALTLRRWRNAETDPGSEEVARGAGLIERIRRAREKGELDPGDIRLGYALNSRIEAKGNIFVSGVGLVNCEVTAAGRAEIHGVVRGGSLFAGGGMKVKEAGSPAGVATTLEVPEGKEIRVEVGHPNVLLRQGRLSRRLAEDEYRIVFPPPEPPEGVGYQRA